MIHRSGHKVADKKHYPITYILTWSMNNENEVKVS